MKPEKSVPLKPNPEPIPEPDEGQPIHPVIAEEIGTVREYSQRGDIVAAYSVVIEKVEDGWSPKLVFKNGDSVYLASGALKYEEAKRIALQRVEKSARQEQEIITKNMAILQRAFGLSDPQQVFALLREMCQRDLAVRRGWVHAFGSDLPDLILPRCDTEAQASIVAARMLREQLMP